MKNDEAKAAEEMVREKYEALAPVLDERSRRLWAATEAMALGHGGNSVVARATGLTRATIRRGKKDLDEGLETTGRIRQPGAGRPKVTTTQPELGEALDRLIDPVTRGDPESPLRWTTKSVAKLTASLKESGFRVSTSTVWRLLRAKGYRPKAVQKSLERRHHEDRDGQFSYINKAVLECQAARIPAISVDTKKKELIGEFAQSGAEWQPPGHRDKVLSHDFPSDAVGKAIPYGVYDIHRNEALVNVGTTHDTPAFAVASIRRWWHTLGRQAYPDSKELLITADCGGSNGYRARAWKAEIQAFANDTGLTVRVAHFPPGTSKWNKIEHRLFCHLSQSWRGRPLVDYTTIIELIGHTTTKTGLAVHAILDDSEYPTGVKVPDEDMKGLNITKDPWHGEWNYTIAPVPE